MPKKETSAWSVAETRISRPKSGELGKGARTSSTSKRETPEC